MKRFATFAVATFVAMFGLTAAGTGVAGAAPVLSLSQSTGLTDGQTVTITVSGLAMDPLATLEISECGNAYGDNSALPSVDTAVGSRDCEVLGFSSPGGLALSSSIEFAGIPIKETGIGNGNRSCAAAPVTPCTVYISQSNNEGGTHASSTISFASDAPGAAPAPTETSVSIVGAPLAVSKAAYAHVEVHRVGDGVVPEGSFSVSVDGGTPVSVPVGLDGAATVQVSDAGSLALGGGHTVSADYTGDGSFTSSSSDPVPFSIIGDFNISVGDGSVVNSSVNALYRTIMFPIVLSKAPSAALTVNFHTSDGTAVAGTDYLPLNGKTKFAVGPSTAHYVAVRVLPNANPGGTFTFNVDAPVGGLAGGYVFRRPVGTGTIIADPLAGGANDIVNIGDAAVPEGDAGGAKALKFSLTLSAPAPTTFRVLVAVAAVNAIHKSRFNAGDWTGGVIKSIKFNAGQLNRTVAVATLPDTLDEPNKLLTVDVIALCTTASTLVQCTAHPANIAVGRGHGVGTILSDE